MLTLGADGGVSLAGSPVVHAIVTTRPNPPEIGPAQVDVRLVDGAQQPLPEATVQIRPRPPDGSAVPPAAGRPAPGTPGLYQADLTFGTPGLWLLIIEVDRPGRPLVRVDASFAVRDPRTPSAAGQ